MRSTFTKIFLSFWLSQSLIAICTIFISIRQFETAAVAYTSSFAMMETLARLSIEAYEAGGCAALGLAIYRKFVSRWEDDNMHVREYDAPRVARQAGIAAMLDSADKWGITLTITVIVYGALLVGAYVYQQWLVSTQLVP